MISVLGIDPGHDGGAVLLASDGCRSLAAWSWQRRKRKSGDVYLLTPTSGREWEVGSLHYLASHISGACSTAIDYEAARVSDREEIYDLAVEGLFVWPGRTGGIIELAEAVGEIIGPLRPRALSLSRCAPSEWRSAILPRGWGRSSDEAERAARQVAASTVRGLGPFVEYEIDGDGREVPIWPHVCEAVCIARWGWVTARGAAQQSMVGR